MESLHSLDINWMALGSFAVIQAIILMLCDMEHFIPKWSLRLFLIAVALQSLGILMTTLSLIKAAQLVSTAGIAWIMFGLLQDIMMHRRNHQH